MAKFKVGDKVLVKENLKGDKSYKMEDGFGDTVVANMVRFSGKVVTISRVGGKYNIKEDYGRWNWTDGMFEGLASNSNKIVITTDGKTTTARLFDGKKMIRKAEARCSSDDEFDFMVGAKLAMERLEVEEPKKPTVKVGDFVMVKGGDGHHHYIADGQICEVTGVEDDGTSIWVRGYNTVARGIGKQYLLERDYEAI